MAALLRPYGLRREDEPSRRPRSRVRRHCRSALLAGATLASCFASKDARAPTPAFAALEPETIAVAEPAGGGDAHEKHVGAEIARELRELGYDVVAPWEPADARLLYWVDSEECERGMGVGAPHARVIVSLELRGPSGTVFEALGRGWGADPLEEEEEEVWYELEDYLFDPLFNAALDSVFPPDYEALFEIAARDAVHEALERLPERVRATTPR